MMKKLLAFLLAAALVCSCCACAPKEEGHDHKEDPGESITGIFPDGVLLCGVDVSGMTAEEAMAAVEERAAGYTLELVLGEDTIPFTAEEIGLSCGITDYEAILEACLEDSDKRDITVDGLITYDESLIEAALKELSGDAEPAQSAYLAYSEKEKSFILMPEKQGGGINIDAVLSAVRTEMPFLPDTIAVDAETAYQPAEITMDSQQAKDALEKANKMLAVELTYTYAPEGVEPATEVIDQELIRKWLVIDEEDKLTVEIDPGPLNEYVAAMDEAHSLSSGTSKFKTTGGGYIDVRVPSAGQTVDTDKLYNDIFECITNGTSGDREAPYVEKDTDSTANFGGNYVEIDLSSQHCWVYNGGTCVVSTSIVSGCVNTGHRTPTGLYKIQSKETSRYLVGPGYKSWVDYWMPFNGGIGLHDATWRWSFGGTIYQYSGSHGCINMPHSAAATTYSNVSVGTYVIVYGGVSSVTPISQSISGTGSYTVNQGDSSFKLDAAPAYSTTLSYSSSNSAVVKVSADGTVTVVGPGTATITVKAEAKDGYTSATKTITITVNKGCTEANHKWDDGKVTTEATCTVEGVKTFTCSVCGGTKTEAVAKADHISDTGTETKAPTCGAAGTRTFSCTKCGNVIKTEEIPATGKHVSDGGKVTQAPTCAADGVKTYSCTGCGKVMKTETLPKDTSKHTYAESGRTNPTCTTDGSVTYTCSGCQHSYTETIAATGHSFADGACTVCGAADPNAPVTPPPAPEPEPTPEPDPEGTPEPPAA